jgi:predicted GNAT family acetyltransferase
VSEAKITDNVERHQFEMDVPGGIAFLVYKRAGNRLHLLHAEVPLALRGRGWGARLVKAVLEKVRDEGVVVVPHCWFVREYMEHNPEYDELTRERATGS